MKEQGLLFDANRVRYLTAQEAMNACNDSQQAIVQKGRYYVVSADDMPEPPYAILGRDKKFEKECVLTTLSFSGGRQSTWCLEAIIRGDLPRPENFLVVTADTGVERKRTYRVIREYQDKCAKAGIEMVIADGPKLGADLRAMQSGEKSRIDNPPLYTRAEEDEIRSQEEHDALPQGIAHATFSEIVDMVMNQDVHRYAVTRKQIQRKGQLAQCCTKHYKVAPIRRAIRAKLAEITGSAKVWPGIAETYIGFARHEWERAVNSNEDVKWQKLRFPMIEHDISAERVVADWKRWGLKSPAISMCVCCPFSGLNRLKEMHEGYDKWSDLMPPAVDTPDNYTAEQLQEFEDSWGDWNEAVELDLLLRRFPNAGVEREVYTHQSLTPLPVLANMGFEMKDGLVHEELMCDSGLCFM